MICRELWQSRWYMAATASSHNVTASRRRYHSLKLRRLRSASARSARSRAAAAEAESERSPESLESLEHRKSVPESEEAIERTMFHAAHPSRKTKGHSVRAETLIYIYIYTYIPLEMSWMRAFSKFGASPDPLWKLVGRVSLKKVADPWIPCLCLLISFSLGSSLEDVFVPAETTKSSAQPRSAVVLC